MTAVLEPLLVEPRPLPRIAWVRCPYCPDGLMPGLLAGSCTKPACVACDIAADASYDN